MYSNQLWYITALPSYPTTATNKGRFGISLPPQREQGGNLESRDRKHSNFHVKPSSWQGSYTVQTKGMTKGTNQNVSYPPRSPMATSIVRVTGKQYSIFNEFSIVLVVQALVILLVVVVAIIIPFIVILTLLYVLVVIVVVIVVV